MILEQADVFQRVINRQDLEIKPWSRHRLQPASYDLALDNRFLVFDPSVGEIDPLNLVDYTKEVRIEDGDYFCLQPAQFILGATQERFYFPADLAGELTGKSSLGRLGLIIHATAGFFDPGFRGVATLEMSNIAPVPIRLYPGMLIAQMRFVKLSRTSLWPYGHPEMGSHYQDQTGPLPSRYSSLRGIRKYEQMQLPGVQWEAYETGQRRGW